jgi:hypothetical protein
MYTRCESFAVISSLPLPPLLPLPPPPPPPPLPATSSYCSNSTLQPRKLFDCVNPANGYQYQQSTTRTSLPYPSRVRFQHTKVSHHLTSSAASHRLSTLDFHRYKVSPRANKMSARKHRRSHLVLSALLHGRRRLLVRLDMRILKLKGRVRLLLEQLRYRR